MSVLLVRYEVWYSGIEDVVMIVQVKVTFGDKF